MRPFTLRPSTRILGAVSLPGDKSIAHRAAILSALSSGKTVIRNFPDNHDCLATIDALEKLGLRITRNFIRSSGAGTVTVYSKGPFGLKKPKGPIFVRDSGTTIRLLAGLLAGQDFASRLTCGRALGRRPMRRICEPLRMMGAQISSRVTPRLRSGQEGYKTEEYPPLRISGGKLRGITYKLPIPSAQVKSAILLAGLYARGNTRVIEPVPSRDHTERMLKIFGAAIKTASGKTTLTGCRRLRSPGRIDIPADISSAAFFIVMAAINPDSLVELENVGLNPSRTGLIRVLKRMGADITVQKTIPDRPGREPAGDIFIRGSALKGTVIRERELPSLIDEIPVLMVAACFARGRTVIRGAEELRVKETDRIGAMSYNLSRMSGRVKRLRRGQREDIVVEGVGALRGARVKSFGDHRTAMSMLVAGTACAGTTEIDDVLCINKSFPGFIKAFKSLGYND